MEKQPIQTILEILDNFQRAAAKSKMERFVIIVNGFYVRLFVDLFLLLAAS